MHRMVKQEDEKEQINQILVMHLKDGKKRISAKFLITKSISNYFQTAIRFCNF